MSIYIEEFGPSVKRQGEMYNRRMNETIAEVYDIHVAAEVARREEVEREMQVLREATEEFLAAEEGADRWWNEIGDETVHNTKNMMEG